MKYLLFFVCVSDLIQRNLLVYIQVDPGDNFHPDLSPFLGCRSHKIHPVSHHYPLQVVVLSEMVPGIENLCFFATILVTLASVLSALSLSSRCHKGSTMNRQQGIDPTYIAISIFSRCQGSNGNALQSLKQTWLPPSASSTKTPLFPFPTGFLAEVRGIYSKTKVFFIKIKLQSVCTQCMLLRGEEQKTSGTLTSKVLVSGAILMLSTTLQ